MELTLTVSHQPLSENGLSNNHLPDKLARLVSKKSSIMSARSSNYGETYKVIIIKNPVIVNNLSVQLQFHMESHRRYKASANGAAPVKTKIRAKLYAASRVKMIILEKSIIKSNKKIEMRLSPFCSASLRTRS